MADNKEISQECWENVKEFFEEMLEEYEGFVRAKDWEDVDEALWTIQTRDELEVVVRFMKRWVI